MTAITDDTLTPDEPSSPNDTPNVHDSMASARLAGYSWDEIHGHLDSATDQALAAGYSQDEIDSHLGYNSSAGLGDALRIEGQIAVADATRDGADMHALEAASGGVIPAPEQDKAPEAAVNPSVAQNYVRALTNREVMGPEDFAQTYAQSIYDAAAEPGIDPFGIMQPHIDDAAKHLAGQLPTLEDATDHAIALVQAAGHEPTPELVAVAREQMLDRWADTGATLQQTLSQAQDDPWLADTLTRAREFAVPPSLAELEIPKRDEVVDPFNAVGQDIYHIADTFLGVSETSKAHDEWLKVFNENLKPDAETGVSPGYGPALSKTIAQVGMDPAATAVGMGSVGPEGGHGTSARFSSRLLEHLNAAGKDADPAAAVNKVLNEHADAVAKDQVIQQTLGEFPSRPRNEAEATMRFTRGDADREVAVAKARLDQYQQAVQKALPDHEETIKQVQAAGSFTSYLKEGGKLDDLTIAKLYVENRGRLDLTNPFPEEHPLYGFADTMRDIHQGIRDRLEQNPLFDGMGFHEDYYRHMWADPNQADRVFGAGREGSASSTRAREIPTEMQGIERGLTPKIPDPIANTMQYMQGLLYHEATLNTLAMGRTSGSIVWRPSDTVAPEKGWERLNGKTANTARSWNSELKVPSTELALWQGEHLPEVETPGTAVALREGAPPATVEAMQAQREGNQKRIESLKSEIAVQEANHQDVAPLRQELEARQAHDDRIAGQIEDMRKAQPETETELNRPTSETLKPERPPAEAATKLVSYAWAPKGYARAYNSWVGRGFYDHPWMGPLYSGLQYASNMMNGFKLSLSGYHVANIAQETGVAGIARAYGELPRGDLKRGLANLGMGAAILPEMGHLWKVGKNFENAYLRTGGNAVDPALVDLFTQAGGRVGGRAAQYRIDGRDNLVAAFRSGAIHNEVRADARAALGNPDWNPAARAAYATVGIPKMVLEQVARGVDSINAPLFDKIIPRIKQGAWATEMADFLHQNPTADKATQLSHARRIMDSIDDRFGEMNQDNLFWNRYAKQMMNLLTVSIGWEYGTMRAFGHAGFDIATGNWNSTRARWLPAFLSMTALQNGMSQYLHTNTLPNTATNWMLGGKTGGTNADRTPEISGWPSYGKELINATQIALRTHDAMGAIQNLGGYILGKENSFWQMLNMARTGKDWDDVSLRTKWEVIHHNPPNVFQSLYQLLKSATLPISLQQLGQRKAGSHISVPEQLLGERPLGKQIANPEGYQKAMDYLHAKDKEAEAKRELKEEQQLESPDSAKIDALQQTLMEVKQQLAQGGGGGGGSRGPSLAALRRVDAPSSGDAAAPRTRAARVAPAPAGTTYGGPSFSGGGGGFRQPNFGITSSRGSSRSAVTRPTVRAPSTRSAAARRAVFARTAARRR